MRLMFLASQDVRLQLPSETHEFDLIYRGWNQLMQQSITNESVFDCCLTQGRLEELLSMEQGLDRIQSALSAYIEDKRRLFPRFYMVSSDDLVQILSKSARLQVFSFS
jgi:dynein heavy chain, axonemal